MKTNLTLLASFLFILFSGEAFCQSGSITLADAQRISDAAQERAQQDNWNVVIVILDDGGNLISLRRMDGTQLGSIDVALEKAKTAVYFKRSTKVFQDMINDGNSALLGLPNVMAVEGGLPIMRGDRIIGSIGISGVTSAQDGIIAEASVKAM
ncbi:GlcG/HbpS family heme-binding protein [Autumnicola psychrophila]|uniref:Heme-binding protein n=1 Tax=Autumnicola psychrophila TaxID=3075592 RepID=A0ABU3DQ05_9FLAO|nr:heme-binding protein [Zunongwangia sp. F225]MDT0685604.1 heme-binding protein [Zunongwangia sp. F225]